MDPHPVGQVGVGAGDGDRRGADAAGDAFDRCDRFFVQIGRDEHVAEAEQVGRAEAPCIITTDEEGVLEGHLDAAIDDEETVMLAERDLRYLGLADAGVVEAIGGLPVVLGAERCIDLEPGDDHREHLVTRLERFDGDAPSGRHMDERAEEEAVGAGTPT